MGEVISHPRFDRPKVHQPCPRRRKGTVSLRKYRAGAAMAHAERDIMPVRSGDVATLWVDGALHEFLGRLRQAGLTLRACRDERGIGCWLLTHQEPPGPLPAA